MLSMVTPENFSSFYWKKLHIRNQPDISNKDKKFEELKILFIIVLSFLPPLFLCVYLFSVFLLAAYSTLFLQSW